MTPTPPLQAEDADGPLPPIPEIVRTWERVRVVLPKSDPTAPADPSVNLDTLAAIAHAKWSALEIANRDLDRLTARLQEQRDATQRYYELSCEAIKRAEAAEAREAALREALEEAEPWIGVGEGRRGNWCPPHIKDRARSALATADPEASE